MSRLVLPAWPGSASWMPFEERVFASPRGSNGEGCFSAWEDVKT
ncbi:hypothetical protein D187_005945 [Cystobacter fuscus DSM 2262]|uniref:Uncharacterized protein n=1 Tax=Cystobacter fuscus (strain ATCC 25194 / DSM 2262 / NBRC 100088 / M29) TaxID=1242864 RepID=S9QQH8_CYSF2|nr:hypothetical protein D187_005945 [Cystobacter fuscus DSM 2262]